MGRGRRSAPSAPPIPSRPLPPSAYGIGVPGTVAPGQQYVPPQPPPPPATPYSVPASSSSRFAGYAGPLPTSQPLGVHPFAVAQPAPGQWVPTGRPHRIHPALAMLIAVVASFFFVGVLAAIAIPSFLAQRAHHIGVLPVVVGDATQLSGPDVDAQVARGEATNPSGRYHINHQQFGVYSNGSRKLVVEIGELPPGAGLDPDDFFGGVSGTAGAPLHPVDNGSWSGATRCGAVGTAGTMCVWVDNGTVGLVVVPSGDEATTLGYLGDVRAASERR